ncbi:Peak1 [Phodopus roborovskii]|uniref:Inactive tyrosine-protein kinase PEAK1 n=1 Tax=Phodopus roborovskii TaxID=109678 RepID=A0AAU9ZUD5_PHORO|nr:Peak1 [Phodopus roborovskii]
MSACNTFTEHVWKPGECKNCFKPKSLHQLPPDSEKTPNTHGNVKTNANHSNNHRVRNTGNFRPPVAKKPTIAVKPTMMVADGQSVCGELSIQEHCENKPVILGWNQNKTSLSQKPLNNNSEDAPEGFGHAPQQCGNNDSAKKIPSNNNGLTDVLKEIAGLDATPHMRGNETNSRETFLGRINDCYKRSLERKIPPSCMIGSIKDSQGKHVILSGSTEVISNEGGRFCYPEFSSGEESEEDVLFRNMEEEHESWDESDEELLAMEIRMRGQPRFANFRANTLSPVRFFVSKKWNTIPLRNKSLQRICAVDYDDSYDEILNGYEENSGVSYGQGSIQSMVSSHSTSPDSSFTEESRSETASSLSQKICNGGLSPGNPGDSKDMTETESNNKSPPANNEEKDSPLTSKSSAKVPETHKAVLALRLEEKDGKIAVQTEKLESKASTDIAGQAVTISLVPVEEQTKPYRVVNLEQPLCKPYTVVDVSAAMASEHLGRPKIKGSSSTPNSPVTSPALTPGQINANFKKSSAIRYQEVWTSSTSPRQKIPKIELSTGGAGPNVPPRKNCHKSAPTSPTTTNVSSKTIPVKSPNLSEIKFNSYNNAGMPPFPIIIHDEPSYARSSKNAIKVPIVINPNAYDNLAIYKSFLGTSGELSVKEKTTSVISHTYEEIESDSKVSDNPTSKLPDCPQAKGFSNSTERKRGSVAQKVQEFNNCLNRGQSSPQRSYSSSHSSPAKIQRPSQEPVAKTEGVQGSQVAGSSGSTREKASAVLCQIVASIQPPQTPPEGPQSSPKACSVEELYAIPPDADTTKSIPKNTPVRPKSLFTSQSSGEAEAHQTTESPTTKIQKDPFMKTVTSPPSKLVTSAQSNPPPPFPPPRSTSSPYHASNLLQRHFTNWTKPTSPTRSTEAESILHSEGSRRAADAKPKRWISFKSFFRRRKADEEEEKEKEREKGKLVGLDGTVIHMLPPPPVQRHHWFTEAKGESNEKPAIVFMYRCDPDQGQLSVDQSKAGAEKGRTEDVLVQNSEEKKSSHSSPSQIPDKASSRVTHEVAEEFSPQDPKTLVVRQDGTSVPPVLPPPDLEREEEKDDASDPIDLLNSCSATYSNLVTILALFQICKSKAQESQQYYHSLAVRQSLAVHFNIQQDCGHFLAEVPNRLLPWEDPDAPEKAEDETENSEGEVKAETAEGNPQPCSETESSQKENQHVTNRKQRSHVVVITREVPHLTVADFVRDSLAHHGKSPDLYERQVCLLLLQLCSGLEHLKPYHVTHCDLRLENLLLVQHQPGGAAQGPLPTDTCPTSAYPTRLIVSNFSQAKQKSHLVDPQILRDQSRLAPEIITATQYKKCDEFQTGILIYEMLHLPNPFDENPELKEKEYTRTDLPRIPLRSPYSWGLQQLASCLLNPNPSERILISDAKGILQCLLWGPREDLFQSFTTSTTLVQKNALLQNWLDIKRTLLMIKFAEKSLDREGGISLEDWLCAQYLAFATTDSLSYIVKILQHR